MNLNPPWSAVPAGSAFARHRPHDPNYKRAAELMAKKCPEIEDTLVDANEALIFKTVKSMKLGEQVGKVAWLRFRFLCSRLSIHMERRDITAKICSH
jgi:hypothetical protein